MHLRPSVPTISLVMLLTLAACSAGSADPAPSAAASPPAPAPADATTTTDATTTDATSTPDATTTFVATTDPSVDSTAEADIDRSEITLSLTLYVVADADDPESPLGTRRTVADVETVATEMASIWSQADVAFEPVRVLEIEMPGEVLAEIATTGRTDEFFAQAGRTFDLPDAGAVNGFYVREAAGVNGFGPIASRVFFVVDEPTVNDRRVSSHEVGHILGLHHDPFDQGRLMFSGTNGELLTDVEQAVARYSAEGILDGVR